MNALPPKETMALLRLLASHVKSCEIDHALAAVERAMEPKPKDPPCPVCGDAPIHFEGTFCFGCTGSEHPAVYTGDNCDYRREWRALCAGWEDTK